MNNYQLYRSNVLLGGQLKWNISLKSSGGILQVDDFHLAPISKWIPFNNYVEENLLNYDHKDNIRDFYKRVGNYFYSESINPRLQLKQPIIVEEGEKVNTYNDIYDMGLSRISYKLHKKSFQFFCPLWLEDFGTNDSIKFTFAFRSRTKEDSGEITYQEHMSKSLILGSRELSYKYSEYHKKFLDYFNKYISYISPNQEKIGDNLINIDFKRNFMTVEGVDVSSGSVRTINTSLTLPNLYSRERPLMEFDRLIIDNFSNNNLVAKQLFNFNFIFNIEDIMDREVVEMLYGDYVNIDVKVFISHEGEEYELLDRVSFDTNYEFVDKGDGELTELTGRAKGSNVLDYLFDYNCIDLLDKNKLCQSITHWSLKDYPESYFNLYSGFENYPMLMQDQVNLWSDGKDIRGNERELTESDKAARDWCRWRTVDTNELVSCLKQLINVNIKDDIHPYLSYIDPKKRYIRGNRMKPFDEIEDGDAYLREGVAVGVLNVKYSNKYSIGDIYELLVEYIRGVGRFDENNNVEGYSLFPMYDSDNKEIKGLYIFVYDTTEEAIMFINTINSDSKLLMYKNFKRILYSTIKNLNTNQTIQNTLKTIYQYLTRIEEPLIIKIEKGLSMTKTNSPTVDSTEIEYEKLDNTCQYHFRYDGCIVPRFSKDFLSYRLRTITKEEYKKNWNKYSEYLPLYPSIDYFYINKADVDSSTDSNNEIRWFDQSNYIFINTVDEFVIENNQMTNPRSIEELIKDYLSKKYKKQLVDIIFSLYDYESNYEYSNLEDTNTYKYTIKLTLK